jgi:hypothetical protein
LNLTFRVSNGKTIILTNRDLQVSLQRTDTDAEEPVESQVAAALYQRVSTGQQAGAEQRAGAGPNTGAEQEAGTEQEAGAELEPGVVAVDTPGTPMHCEVRRADRGILLSRLGYPNIRNS